MFGWCVVAVPALERSVKTGWKLFGGGCMDGDPAWRSWSLSLLCLLLLPGRSSAEGSGRGEGRRVGGSRDWRDGGAERGRNDMLGTEGGCGLRGLGCYMNKRNACLYCIYNNVGGVSSLWINTMSDF